MKRLLLVSIVFLLFTFAIQAISISKAFADEVVLLVCQEGKEQIRVRHVSDSGDVPAAIDPIEEKDSCAVTLAELLSDSYVITARHPQIKFKKRKPEANQVWYELTKP